MLEYLAHILEKISFLHLNALLILGLALFGGVVGGRIFQKLRIPQVVGYIIIGIVIGHSGFKLINDDIIKALDPFTYFALGLIGFMVGGELKKEVFKKYGRQLIYILLCEGIAPFILVTIFAGIAGSILFSPSPFIWALALLLGAIASATDPATTTSVLKEYKTRGPLTSTILGIVALDDGLALLLFAIASSIASILIGQGHAIGNILHALYEIGGAIGIGIVSGLFLSNTLRRYVEKEKILVFSIGMVLLITGLSLAAGVSMLLAVMTLGVVTVNTIPKKSKEAFSLVEGFAPPIYVLFFVLVGAKLQLDHMTKPVLCLVFIYLVCGMGGKAIGSKIGAHISKAATSVKKYLPFSLFSQAGIAIGLSILAAHHFPANIGNTLIVIIAATTFITQLLGPSFTKLAVTKAQETGLNITEEDILQNAKAGDFMDKNPPLIYENTKLSDILETFSKYDNLYYPVIDKEKRLRGIITIEGIRQTFLETGVGGLILAHDLMEPVHASAHADMPMPEVKDVLNRHDTEYLPIVDVSGKIEGFIEKKKLNKIISTKILELEKQAASLETT